MYEVRLKPGHPTGIFRRAGKVFTTNEPVKMNKIPPEIGNDPSLQIIEIPPGMKSQEAWAQAEKLMVELRLRELRGDVVDEDAKAKQEEEEKAKQADLQAKRDAELQAQREAEQKLAANLGNQSPN